MSRYLKSEAQEWSKLNIRGHWTTLVTPFTDDDHLDETGLRRNIRHVQKLGVSGMGCTWGMGEFWSLTREERLRIYDIVNEEAINDTLLAAHVTHTSIHEMIKLAMHAEKIGMDLLVVAAPYFVTKTESQVIEYVKVLSEITSLAIMFYNSPQFGIVMSPDGLKTLCDIPNVVGVKEASFDRQLSLDTHMLIGDSAIISTPDEWILFKGAEMGFQQQVMFANTSDWRFDRVGKNHYVNFIRRAISGDIDHSLYDAHIKPIKEISDRWWQQTVKKYNGVLPVTLCKYWGEIMGMAGGHVRPPLINFSSDDKKNLVSDISLIYKEAILPVGDLE